MERILVRITESHLTSYEHLVGTLAIGYGSTPGLGGLLRLPAPDPILGRTRYILSEGVEVNPIRATTFDNFEEVAS